MKKLICVILFFVLSVVCAAPYAMATEATETTDPDVSINISYLAFTAEVPEGFDKDVRIVVTKSNGTSSVYEITAKNLYVLAVGMKFGNYTISGYVENDPLEEYVVLISPSEIELSKEEMEIEVVVTKAPSSGDPTGPSGATTPSGTPGASEGGSDPSAATDPSAPATTPDKDTNLFKKDTFSWKDFLLSAFTTAAFIGVVIIGAYFYRKYRDRF